MKILVIGNGGREHALAWKFAREPHVDHVVAAPGNPGIARIAHTVPVAATDLDALLALARSEQIDLTVVGPEAPLDKGVADLFRAHGLRIFGPTRAAAAPKPCPRKRLLTAGRNYRHLTFAEKILRTVTLPGATRAAQAASFFGCLCWLVG